MVAVMLAVGYVSSSTAPARVGVGAVGVVMKGKAELRCRPAGWR